MSELRWDPLKKCWVIITRSQGRGPADFYSERQQVHLATCPFCYGQEARTPHEVFALRVPGSAPDTSGWKVRVIPNKYPVLRIEGSLETRGRGLYDVMDGVGAHEIIIENPDHDRPLHHLEVAEITDVLTAWRARLLDLRKDMRFRYLSLFKNYGVEAGAGIPHSHCQLVALPVTPPVAATELVACRDYFAQKERCLLCDILAQELQEGERVVRNDGQLLVYAPFASAHPFELRIVPLHHQHDFGSLGDNDLSALAAALKDALLRISVTLRDPPYNFILHNAPPMQERQGRPDYWQSLVFDYHWHIEVVPRLTKIAGFEWGTGFFTNQTRPEEAARYLRESDLSTIL